MGRSIEFLQNVGGMKKAAPSGPNASTSFTYEMLDPPSWHDRENKVMDSPQGNSGKRPRPGVGMTSWPPAVFGKELEADKARLPAICPKADSAPGLPPYLGC